MSLLKPPEKFAGMPVIAVVKVMEDPSEIPNKYVIVTQQVRACNVHTVHFNGVVWVGGGSVYELSFSRALDEMCERAKRFGGPDDADGWCPSHGRYFGACIDCGVGEEPV